MAQAAAPTDGALLRTAARIAGVDVGAVERLSTRLLDHDVVLGAPLPERSALNSNGDPLQLCISVAQGRTVVRLIADPAADEPDPSARRARGRSAMARGLVAAGLPVEPFGRMLEMVLPDQADESWDPAVGESWLAAPVEGRAFAVYGNGAWGPPALVWPRVLDWLAVELPGSAGAERIREAAHAGHLVPAAVGLEMDGVGRRRVKVYVRLAGSVPLHSLGIAALRRPEVAGFLRTVLTGAPLPRTGLVLAIGLRPDADEIHEVKLDVCACDRCLPALNGPWPVTLRRLSARLGCPFDWDSALVPGVRPAFIGMGVGTGGPPRLNLYLQSA